MPSYLQENPQADELLRVKQAEIMLPESQAQALSSLVKSVTEIAQMIEIIASFSLTGSYAEGTMLRDQTTANAAAILKGLSLATITDCPRDANSCYCK